MKFITKTAVLFLGLLLLFAPFYYNTWSEAQTAPKLNLGKPLAENVFVELAKAINPTVVNISTARMPRQNRRSYGGSPFGGQRDPFFDMFEQYFNDQRMPQRPEQSLGTGFVIRNDGLILTNNHVVEGADVVKVQLSDNEKTLYTAEIIGRDKRTDIALIKIDAKRKLDVAVFGSSLNLQVGEWVAAFGNPLGLGHTVSQGIISAKGRAIDELNRFSFLQTDASINPGNSGGPLVNLKGEVIGVNTAIAANSQGIGFAIPIDDVKSVITLLEKQGVVRRGFLGVNLYPYPIHPEAAQEMKLPTTKGALIVGVVSKSAAEKAGLKEYDFIIKYDGKDVSDSENLSRLIADSQSGKTYEVEYYRQGKKRSTKVNLLENPEDVAEVRSRKKTYVGQKAPFALGFTVTNYSKQIADEFRLPPLRRPLPVVIDVDFESPAAQGGLGVGDVIVDVNRQEVNTDKDVLKALKKGQINSLRVLRGSNPTLIYISPESE